MAAGRRLGRREQFSYLWRYNTAEANQTEEMPIDASPGPIARCHHCRFDCPPIDFRSERLCRQRQHFSHDLQGRVVIGASGGGGKLVFHGRTYKLGVGGINYGLLFGGSKTELHGRVTNIQRASDVAGVYAAAGAGLALGEGVRAIVLTNQNGAVLELSGRQVGLMANADLSGLAITMK